MIRIVLNGTSQEVEATTDLQALVAEHVPVSVVGDGPRGVAAAVNDAVVPRPHWPRTALTDGDRVEVVSAVPGG